MLKKECHYNICFSERSTGKTTNVGLLIIEQYLQNGMQSVYIRRHDKDVTRRSMLDTFGNIVPLLPRITDRWNDVVYDSRRFYLRLVDEDTGEEIERDTKPFIYVLSLSIQDSTKSVFNNNNIGIIWFEEFITRDRYIPDEFVRFQNLISTCVRLKAQAIIIMTANTTNPYCPYFEDMGLYKVRNQKINTIDVYTYGNSGLRVAVEYGGGVKTKKESNIYFAFDNPRLEMIKNGSWEIASYPHPSWHTAMDDIVIDDIWFVMSDRTARASIRLQCGTGVMYMLIVPTNTTEDEIKLKPSTLIFADRENIKKQYNLFFTTNIGKLVLALFQRGDVYYADNMVGEMINNFLQCYRNYGIIRR